VLWEGHVTGFEFAGAGARAQGFERILFTTPICYGFLKNEDREGTGFQTPRYFAGV